MAHAICAVATPSGHSAIAVIRLSGDKSHEHLARLFIPANKNQSILNCSILSAFYGKLVWQEQVIDDVIVLVFPPEKSFTGEASAEIQCHGTPVIVKKILKALYETGVEPAKPGEFTYRAYLAGKIDLSQAEAIKELVDARSERQLQGAQLKKGGALSKKLSQFRSDILNLLADMTAELDFSDEGIEFVSSEEKTRALKEMQDEIVDLMEQTRRSRVYRQNLEAVLIGAPNAGKSSLMNLLSGKDRSLVSQIAGTTRDYIDQDIEIAGIEVTLVDTAGLRAAQDEVEKMGTLKTAEKYNEADMRLFVIDSSVQPGQQVFNELRSYLKADHLHKSLILLNKWDIAHPEWAKHYREAGFWKEMFQGTEFEDELYFEKPQNNILAISSKSGYGLGDLTDKLKNIVENLLPHSDSLVLATWQAEILEKINILIGEVMAQIEQKVTPEIIAENMNLILEQFSELSGKASNEELLGRIFSRFCIGK